MACAWATSCAMGSMMVVSFVWGKSNTAFPMPGKTGSLYGDSGRIYFIHMPPSAGGPTCGSTTYWPRRCWRPTVFHPASPRKKEFRKLPVVGKYISPLQTGYSPLKPNRSRLPVTGQTTVSTRKHVQRVRMLCSSVAKFCPGRSVASHALPEKHIRR